MKVFEFRFNPSVKPDLIFDSFCYQPQSAQEKKLGSLYVIGELKNSLPQNSRLLANLALLLKREYFLGTLPDRAFKKALKKANDFLSERVKTGNVSWLGNLSLAVLNFQDLTLSFSKDGPIKILLLRPGQVTDLTRSLETDDFEPYPLKIFTNIVSGRFLENDKILICTKGVGELLSLGSFLTDLSRVMTETGLKDFFRQRENNFSTWQGACFLLWLTRDTSAKSSLVFKKDASFLSLAEIFSPFRKRIAGLSEKVRSWRPQFRRPSFSLPQWSWPEVSFDWQNQLVRQKLFLTVSLLAVLLLGFLEAKREESGRETLFRERLISLQEEMVKGQKYLAAGQTTKALSVFQSGFQQFSSLPLTRDRGQEKAAADLKALFEKNLLFLNGVEENPQLTEVFDFGPEKFGPQKLIEFENHLYVFSPYHQELAQLSLGSQSELFKIETSAAAGFNLASSDGGNLYFFSKPNRLWVFWGDRIRDSFSLKLESGETSVVDFSANRSSLYFLEKETGQIWRYQKLSLNETSLPSVWIQPQEKKALNAKSFQAVNGSVFVLTRDNNLWEYRGGQLIKTSGFSVFPELKRPSKIIFSNDLARLIILEPSQSRIIFLSRQNQSIKQLKSPSFLNLKDAVFSSDGRFLYILSGDKVYRYQI